MRLPAAALSPRPFVTLADLPGPSLQIVCTKCSLRVTRDVGALIAERGPDQAMTYFLEEITAACPKRLGGNLWDWCAAHYTPESLPAVNFSAQGTGR